MEQDHSHHHPDGALAGYDFDPGPNLPGFMSVYRLLAAQRDCLSLTPVPPSPSNPVAQWANSISLTNVMEVDPSSSLPFSIGSISNPALQGTPARVLSTFGAESFSTTASQVSVPQDEYLAICAALEKVNVPAASAISFDQGSWTPVSAAFPLLSLEVVEETLSQMDAIRAADPSPILGSVPHTLWEAIRVATRLPPSSIDTSSAAFQTARTPPASVHSSPMEASPTHGPIFTSTPEHAGVSLFPSLPPIAVMAPNDRSSPAYPNPCIGAPADRLSILTGGDKKSAGVVPRGTNLTPLVDYASQEALMVDGSHASSTAGLAALAPPTGVWQTPSSPGGHLGNPIVLSGESTISQAVTARIAEMRATPARDVGQYTPSVRESTPEGVLNCAKALEALGDEDAATIAIDADEAVERVLEELTEACRGYSYYILNDDTALRLVDNPTLAITAERLQNMASVVCAVLSMGPCTETESEAGDIFRMLRPGDWYRFSSAITAATLRGCVRTPDIARQGEFDFDPCLDEFEHAASIPRPSTQRDALQRMASQLVEELQMDGAMMLPQDSIDGIRNTVWRMHEQYIRAAVTKEAESVRGRISDLGT